MTDQTNKTYVIQLQDGQGRILGHVSDEAGGTTFSSSEEARKVLIERRTNDVGTVAYIYRIAEMTPYQQAGGRGLVMIDKPPKDNQQVDKRVFVAGRDIITVVDGEHKYMRSEQPVANNRCPDCPAFAKTKFPCIYCARCARHCREMRELE